MLVALIIYVAALGLATFSVFLDSRRDLCRGAVALLSRKRLCWMRASRLEWPRQSWHVTRGRWIKTLGATIGFLILALVPGPLAGVLILILGGSRVQFANLTSSFLYGLLLPLAYIGLTMVYRRLKGETIVEPQMITQELHPEKARKLPGIDLGPSLGE